MTFRLLSKNFAPLEVFILILTQVHKQVSPLWIPGSSPLLSPRDFGPAHLPWSFWTSSMGHCAHSWHSCFACFPYLRMLTPSFLFFIHRWPVFVFPMLSRSSKILIPFPGLFYSTPRPPQLSCSALWLISQY